METDGGLTHSDSLIALRRLAGSIGADSGLVQGAGGNVSVKAGDTMWIKASGAWLADAERRDVLIPVALPGSRDGTFTVLGPNLFGLRPSIETSLHAALPHAVVLHVHSVDTIALAVRTDAAMLLAERLAGLRWALVPYRRPGTPLTAALREAGAPGAIDVFVLANHGLVVAAADVATADALLRDVVARLSMPPRAAPPTPVNPATGVPGFRLVADPQVNALAIDRDSLAIATGGVLYPDHVVFLGSAPLVIDADEDLGDALDRLQAAGGSCPRWVIVRDRGCLIATDAARGSEEMLRCLADVAARIPSGATPSFLTEEDVAALTDWEAERYRQRLAGDRGNA
jgi:rhamnose utilization protein RhaD (predicted bifunctional aldolase and dehydrogenase)